MENAYIFVQTETCTFPFLKAKKDTINLNRLKLMKHTSSHDQFKLMLKQKHLFSNINVRNLSTSIHFSGPATPGGPGGPWPHHFLQGKTFKKLTFTNKTFNSWECTMGTY